MENLRETLNSKEIEKLYNIVLDGGSNDEILSILKKRTILRKLDEAIDIVDNADGKNKETNKMLDKAYGLLGEVMLDLEKKGFSIEEDA